MNLNLKKHICTVLAAAMLAPLSSAYAKEWVHVSSWAYNDVSNFTNEGLLPESFNSISDYREPITIEQFCELLYSVGAQSGILETRGYQRFIDSDNTAVNNILSVNNTAAEKIILDVPDYDENMTDEEVENLNKIVNDKLDYYRSIYLDTNISYDGEVYYVTKSNASDILSREAAADILISKIHWINNGEYFYTAVPDGVSYPDASPEAYRGIYYAKLHGLMDASENPKENMTIEQAITAAYRMWKQILTVPRADGSGIQDGTETLIQVYGNGVEEYKTSMYYLLKKEGKLLKQFENDVYKNVYCADTADGRCIAAAQTYYGSTELYDLSDGGMTAKLNYMTYGMDSEYIITKSSDMGPMAFGLCDYSGNTVLEPVYSMEEIDILRQNGFNTIEMPYRKPDGWIYYSDWNDNGKMYRIDSNGENKQLLCEEDCFNTHYIDGFLYYSVRGENENKLFCMKSDGTEKEQISSGFAYIISSMQYISTQGSTYCPIDGWLYYIENDKALPYYSNGDEGYLWRLKHTPEGTIKEQVSDFKLYPEDRSVDCIYLRSWDTGEPYMLTKDGLQKLDFNKKTLSGVEFHGDTVVMILWDKDTESHTYVCAPVGSTSFTECTHKHDEAGYFKENGIYCYINNDLSDNGYQVGSCYPYGKYCCWIKDMTTGKMTYIDSMGYVYDRKGDILYFEGNNKLYSYDIKTAQTTVLAETVISMQGSTDDYILYSDFNKNFTRVNIHDGTITETYPNTGALRYGEFDSLSINKNYHLLKLDKEGRYIDLTNAHAAYYGYVEY
ncbi:MAG: DUF5050 domain-containing protein [bacterium]|nr:DUF5050 domain-containing protein [bacterium]